MRKINRLLTFPAICYANIATTVLKKRLFLLLFTVAGMAGVAIGQTDSLSGTLVDSKGNPLPYANVTLLKAADTAFVAGTLTNARGRFSLPAASTGQFVLRFSAIGFAPLTTKSFEINAVPFSKDLGTLTLKEDVKTMKEVSVSALRPTITQLADRMVVNIEGTAMAAGSTAFDVLAKSPGVFVDAEGNIQLNGRSGVTIMLNGKLTYLSARDLRTMLEGMTAENIKNIEIITNPSSKYDAEGTSGILNINLKKNDRQGMNGSVFSSVNYNGKQVGYTAGGNINYKSGRWASFVNLDAARRVGGREATFTRIFYGTNTTTYFDQVATGNFVAEGPPAVRLGTDYTINKQHSVGAMVNYTTNFATSDFLTDTYIGKAPGQPVQYINADNFSSNRYTNFTVNGHYVANLDTLGTVLSTDLDYVNIRNRGESDFYNYFTDIKSGSLTKDFLYTFIPSGYDIYAAKVDFTRPLKKEQKLELGAKASRVISDNDSRFFFNNNAKILDPQRTNHFNYRENIYAAYINYSGRLSKRLTFQGGLRAEQTTSLGNSYTTGQVTKRNYLNLFPTLFVQQKVHDNYGINYSYSRRLSRPNYGNLNPFRFYRDPYTWIEGNPYLRPQYTHVFSLAQTFKKIYILTVSYQLTKDVISELPMLDVEKTTTIYYTGNMDNGHSASMTGIVPVKIVKGWDAQNTLLLAYNKYSINQNNSQFINDQVFYMLQSNHTILLPKSFRLELNGMYRGPAASGLYHMKAMSRVDAGLKKSFFNKKLDITLNANDIFKGLRYRFTTDLNGHVNEFDQYMRWRTFGISLRYNFSKGQKVDLKRRNNSVDEVNRT